MVVIGDVESVNLRTGERFRRVVGNWESRLESLGIPGLKPVDPSRMAEYDRTMTEEVVPKIINDVRQRQRLAAEARQRIL